MPDLTSQAEQLLQQLPKPIPDYSRLSRADESLILKLADDGRTQTEIAHLVGCSQGTVSNVLRDFADTRQIARKRLNASADTLAEKLAKTKHAPTMLEVLRDIGVTEKQAPAGQSRPGVNVFIGGTDAQVQINLSSDLSPAGHE